MVKHLAVNQAMCRFESCPASMKKEDRPYAVVLAIIIVVTILGFIFGPDLANLIR